jgi:BirA family transcriptional regulator, biotin operon repressor / biotin---[acetyl-CoA-carboxylase] ligase
VLHLTEISSESLAEKLSRPFQFFPSVDSTNDIAQTWLREGAKAGSVVIADEQLKGRGRRGRFWHTPAGVALAISFILKPSPEFATRSSMLGALAVYELCSALGIKQIGIKWPNDVQIQGKKVSGILPEAVWNGEKLLGVVLGIGVNVRVNFDSELAETAINLETATSKTLNRNELTQQLLERLDFWAARIASDELFFTWKNHLSTLGQDVVIEGLNQRIVGQAVDVDSNGTLLIKTPDATILPVMAGEVSLRPQDKGEKQ